GTYNTSRALSVTVTTDHIITGDDVTGRTWSDGSYAACCNGYINTNPTGYSYGGDTGTGVYLIDPDGDDSNAFKVWCDMDRDGGGWTLITSINKKLNADTTSVDNNTLVKPGIDGNYTNRNMQLSPTPSEILTVQDGHDAGQETAYDRTEKWVGVTGAPINWGQIIADLNTNSYYATSFFKGLYLR
ncbi:MAG: fibrinogen-like YCDxxxxGGGW domain-containing protein, partial [Pseudomonadota bacterium]|nr:fibrinogen-like YCDxxxxGGGW domain-containing protein [Pseudomonadota bacterium]